MGKFGVNRLNPPILRKKETLPVQMVIYVPSTVMDRKIKDSIFQKRVKEVKDYMNRAFHGSTKVRAVGSGSDSEEKIMKVEVSTTKELYLSNRGKIADKIKKWREKWNQEGVFYEFEDKAYIYPDMDTRKMEEGKFKRWIDNFEVTSKD